MYTHEQLAREIMPISHEAQALCSTKRRRDFFFLSYFNSKNTQQAQKNIIKYQIECLWSYGFC